MTTETPRILLIDDDPRYGNELSAYLQMHGCRLRAIADPRQVQSTFVAFAPDLVLLDQRLGVTTGTEVLRELRTWSNVPCIVVTGMPDPTDRVVNLEVGADDEVDKSVPSRELLARIRAVLRRNARASTQAEPAGQEPMPMRGWKFSPQLRELYRPDGTLCHLTSAEFDTLNLLHMAGGKAVRRSAICERVFGRPFRQGDRSVDTIVAKLRRKLEPGGASRAIKTVRPFGYVFTGFPEVRDRENG